MLRTNQPYVINFVRDVLDAGQHVILEWYMLT